MELEGASQHPATKNCPFCAEEIKWDAVVCKHCNRDLPSVLATSLGTTAPSTAPKPSVARTIAKTIHWLVFTWTGWCALGVLTGIAKVATLPSASSVAGQIGLTLGLGLWALIWFIPVVAGEIIAVGLTLTVRSIGRDARSNRLEWLIGLGIAAIPNALLVFASIFATGVVISERNTGAPSATTESESTNDAQGAMRALFTRFAEGQGEYCVLVTADQLRSDTQLWRVARTIQADAAKTNRDPAHMKIRVSFWIDFASVPTQWPPTTAQLRGRVAYIDIESFAGKDSLVRTK